MVNSGPSLRGAQLLATLRQKAKLTQTELAKRAGISRSMIAQLEIGDRSPSRKLLGKLCRVMAISIDEEGQLMLAYNFSPSGEAPEQIEAFLRADKRLSYDQAERISSMVREAYEKYVTDSDK